MQGKKRKCQPFISDSESSDGEQDTGLVLTQKSSNNSDTVSLEVLLLIHA